LDEEIDDGIKFDVKVEDVVVIVDDDEDTTSSEDAVDT
jgi:hypothetical protein